MAASKNGRDLLESEDRKVSSTWSGRISRVDSDFVRAGYPRYGYTLGGDQRGK